MVTRRRFVSLLAGAAAVTLIGELPSSKTFFLPPAGGWQPNDLSWEAQGRKIVEALNRSLIYTKEVRAAHILETWKPLVVPARAGDADYAIRYAVDTHYLPSRLHDADVFPYRHSIFEQIWHKRRSVPV